MAKLPQSTQTTVFQIESQETIEKQRTYLGMSGLGDECLRKIYLNFHWASIKKLDTRTKRIFERGDIEEERVVSLLKSVGCEVFAVIDDEEVELTGKIGEVQEEFVGFAGHAKGHCDGRVRGLIEAPKTVHLLEIKTMNDKRFKAFVKDGVKKSDPNYYAQLQRYMSATGLERAYIISVNKNNEEIHGERVHFDEHFAESLKQKEKDIILRENIPQLEFSRTYYKCKYCNHFDVCHNDEAPMVNCRTCRHHELALDGVWICNYKSTKKEDFEIDEKLQREGCRAYERLF